jgi:hypothetical protein
MLARRLVNFIRGAGSVLEILPSGPPVQIRRPFAFLTDADALEYDWQQVGDAFKQATERATKDLNLHGQTEQAR